MGLVLLLACSSLVPAEASTRLVQVASGKIGKESLSRNTH